MRKWGFVITVVYAVVVTILIVPGFVAMSGYGSDIYENWLTWAWISIMVTGQVLLLFLRVDTSMKRLKPRRHLWISIATTSLLAGLLFFSAAWALLAAIIGDNAMVIAEKMSTLFFTWLGFWLIWAVIFSLYTRRKPTSIDHAVGWLIKGSVLELLIAIPCHVITRHRQDCSAPGATGFGIATGIAIMLLAFGPSVLLLYQKRMKHYGKNG